MKIFFYGLFMDRALLEQKGLQVAGAEPARLDDYDLRIGQRAMLVASSGCTVYGVVMDMTREDVERLYAEDGLTDYRPEAVAVTVSSNCRVDAACYCLPEPTNGMDPNRAYAARLARLAASLGFPEHYVQDIARKGSDA